MTTRWDKCGGAPRGPVSAMLPRLKFLFSRGPPSARSPQIRPHPVTVSHLSSVSFFLLLPPSLHAAYSLIRKRKSGTFHSLPSTTITTPLYSKWRTSGRCLFVFSRLLFTALPDRIGLPWPSLSRRCVSRTSPRQNSQELKSSRRGRGPSEGRVCMYNTPLRLRVSGSTVFVYLHSACSRYSSSFFIVVVVASVSFSVFPFQLDPI